MSLFDQVEEGPPPVMRPAYRWLKFLPVAYVAVSAASLVYGMVGGSLAGVYFVLLAFPWSLAAVLFIDALSPALMDAGGGIAAGVVGVLLNAWILHGILRRTCRVTG